MKGESYEIRRVSREADIGFRGSAVFLKARAGYSRPPIPKRQAPR